MDFFKKSSKFFGKCSESSDSSRKLKISKSIFPINWIKTLSFQKQNFSKNAQNGLIWPENQTFLCANSSHWKITGLLFSGELPGTGSIHNSDYWKIAGLAACYFQGNSWKLGASIIRVIGKQQAQRRAIFRGTLGNF